jgi:hypothetical protein
VYYVPADGSAITPPALRVVFTVATGVVACAPAQGGFIYVADRNGAIVEHSANASGIKQAPGAAFITSMAYNGGLALTQMALTQTAPGQLDARWQLNVEAGVSHYAFPAGGANPRLVMFNAAGDVYWLDDDGVVTSPV